MDTRVEIAFADGTYSFWLPLPQGIELERKAGGKSIFAMYDQLGAGLGLNGDDPVYLGGGAAMITDVRETIRLGLIGGGSGFVNGEDIKVGPQTALRLVEEYCYPARPLTESAHIAWTILHAAIVGVQLKKKADDPVKPKRPPRSRKARSSPTAAA